MPETVNSVLGLECRLYIGTAGTGTPSNEVTVARTVELSLTSSMADVTVRASD